VQPPGDDQVQPCRQVFERQVDAPVDLHLAEPVAFGLERLGLIAGENEVNCSPLLRLIASRGRKANPRESGGDVLVLSPAVAVLAVNDPRLVGVQLEAHLRHPGGDPPQDVFRLPARRAVHDGEEEVERRLGLALEALRPS
jgi:hypothetical protein